MTVIAPPEPRHERQPDTEALIEEARRRTRRRRLKLAAVGLAALLGGGGIYAGLELTSNSSTAQAVPPGYHLVRAKGPVLHAVLHEFPSRTKKLDLATRSVAPAELTTEVWWDRKGGLYRIATSLDGDVSYELVRSSCLGPGVCPPPQPWFLKQIGIAWTPRPCCAVVAGEGEYQGHRVRWVEGLVNGRRSPRSVTRAGFDVRSHQPFVYEELLGRHVLYGYTVSDVKTFRPNEIAFAVPDGGAGRNFPSEAKAVRGHGLAAIHDALGTAPLWLGRAYGGSQLRSMVFGVDSTTSEAGTLLRRVPYVRLDYGRFTIDEYDAARRPFGFQSGPGTGNAFLRPLQSVMFERNGVFVLISSASRRFQLDAGRALSLARALRPRAG